MEQEDTYRAALVRAAQLLGSARALCNRLQVPMPTMTHWLAGNGRPPIGVFLKVIDILIEAGAKPRLHDASNDSESAIRRVN